jgi:hypothetical protein
MEEAMSSKDKLSRPLPPELRPLILAAVLVARQILEEEAARKRKRGQP